jgi:hypothetical protein
MDEFLAANRALWDEWTSIHERSEFYDLDGFRRGGIRIADHEIDEIGPATGSSTSSSRRRMGRGGSRPATASCR